MKIKVLTFGALTEVLNKEFDMEAIDTESLLALLIAKHSALAGRSLLIAVNNVVVNSNVSLKENDVVALMPPYSGG
ncbi:MAG: MoaD/ThiS family protein [Chitinophagaceae bacterium]|jgi:molybdopterin converting factor small subunit|nr:MoaD/ThiS family protein [Chitinophagaceae bacterium]